MRPLRALLTVALVAATATLGPGALAQSLIGHGIKVGPLASTVRSPDLLDDRGEVVFSCDTVSRTGLAVLALAEFAASERTPLSIVVEGGYLQRGYGNEQTFTDIEGNPTGTSVSTERFDYLALAMTPKLRRPGPVSPFVIAGPQASVLIGGAGLGTGLRRDYDAVALGAVIGVGVEARGLLPFGVSIEVRRSLDFTDSTSSGPRESYNEATEFLVGVGL